MLRSVSSWRRRLLNEKMGKPTRIKDKVSFCLGIIGIVAISYNLGVSILFYSREPLELFVFTLLTVFSTLFFGWLITSNIRSSEEIYGENRKRKRKK